MRIYFTLMFLFMFVSLSFAQKSIPLASEANQVKKSYPVYADEFERQQERKVAEFLKAHPDYFTKQKLQKTAWSFTVGSTHQWTTWDLSTSSQTAYLVPSTCRAVGTHCYIFVADDVWNKTVNQAAVDSVENEWDNKTPANPNKGIYQTDVDTFGSPPDRDGDPKIIIFIYNIKDGYDSTKGGGYIAGFFSAENEVGGNLAEIYYMDANPTNLEEPSGLELALETAAHEFQHMINWNYHQNITEDTFTNEGLSMVAEIVCGFPASMQNLYAGEPNHYLFDWRRNNSTLVLNDYARAQRFFLYLKEQFGIGILKQVVLDYQNYKINGGSAAIDKILTQKYSTSISQVITNWEIANELNDRSVDTSYGYVYSGLPRSFSSMYGNPNIDTSVTVSRQAASYISFVSGSNLNITFTGGESGTFIKALEIGNNVPNRVLDVSIGTPFTEQSFGTSYKTITFAIINTDPGFAPTVNYSASGTSSNTVTELKWDDTEPIGYLPLSKGDSVAVQFDGLSGATLDSIKIALRDIYPIKGNIFTFTGLTNQLGGTKLGTFTATPTLTTKPPVVDTSSEYPYPEPYPNWVNVDLTSQNINAGNSFVVEIPVETYPGLRSNAVMVTDYQSTSSYHSFSYASGDTPPDWLSYGEQGKTGYIFLYLIRAYVSYNVSGVKHVVELTPSQFSLSQNYPNPFNPSTKIDFTLPKTSKVKVTIYNQLGQQVVTLAEGEYSAGKHELNFDASNLASGVYYYHIVAGTYSQTKKMILMK